MKATTIIKKVEPPAPRAHDNRETWRDRALDLATGCLTGLSRACWHRRVLALLRQTGVGAILDHAREMQGEWMLTEKISTAYRTGFWMPREHRRL